MTSLTHTHSSRNSFSLSYFGILLIPNPWELPNPWEIPKNCWEFPNPWGNSQFSTSFFPSLSLSSSQHLTKHHFNPNFPRFSLLFSSISASPGAVGICGFFPPFISVFPWNFRAQNSLLDAGGGEGSPKVGIFEPHSLILSILSFPSIPHTFLTPGVLFLFFLGGFL